MRERSKKLRLGTLIKRISCGVLLSVDKSFWGLSGWNGMWLESGS